MTIVQIAFILLTVISLSAGQILFKLAVASIEFSAGGFVNALLNLKLIIALVVYALATIMWLFVLKSTPLRIAYPFTASAFFVVPVLAHFLLGEHISWNTFAGASLIALGVFVSVYK